MSAIERIKELISDEAARQEEEICLIASENYMSKDVMEACGSVLINKYAEGYFGKRYYGGCSVVDLIENKAICLARQLFDCSYVNVQPNSGSQANQAVYLALLNPGDTILGMDLNAGGHLTHGCKASSSGKLYNAVSYGLDENGYLNYDEIKEKLYSKHPRLLIVGASAYPRIIDFERIRNIVDEYNNFIEDNDNLAGWEKDKKAAGLIDKCYYMVDMAHIAGLVATGLHPSPLPYADVVTSIVQKTLRSGRGGLILSNDIAIGMQIDKAVFPGIQGGPLMNMIAGKAIGFAEALEPEFKTYQEQVLKNIKAMEKVFKHRGVNMMSDGTDNHMILLDLRSKGISGKALEDALSTIGIVVNKNAVKDDPRPKTETSGIRLGTPAITTRGALEKDCEWVATQICDMIDLMKEEYDLDGMTVNEVLFIKNRKVVTWCKDHPIYKDE